MSQSVDSLAFADPNGGTFELIFIFNLIFFDLISFLDQFENSQVNDERKFEKENQISS